MKPMATRNRKPLTETNPIADAVIAGIMIVLVCTALLYAMPRLFA